MALVSALPLAPIETSSCSTWAPMKSSDSLAATARWTCLHEHGTRAFLGVLWGGNRHSSNTKMSGARQHSGCIVGLPLSGATFKNEGQPEEPTTIT